MNTKAGKFWTLFAGVGVQVSETFGYVDPELAVRQRRTAAYVYDIARKHLDPEPVRVLTTEEERKLESLVTEIYFPEGHDVRTVKQALARVPAGVFRLPGFGVLTP